MESIVTSIETALETAATHVEVEAVKVEQEVKACGAHIFACVRCHLTKAEAEAKAPIDPALAQALKDAQEDAHVVEGLASRVIHAITALVHRAWKTI